MSANLKVVLKTRIGRPCEKPPRSIVACTISATPSVGNWQTQACRRARCLIRGYTWVRNAEAFRRKLAGMPSMLSNVKTRTRSPKFPKVSKSEKENSAVIH